MTELDEWVTAARAELGLADHVDVELLLDVAREAAHGVQKTAAPVTTYLLGLAVGRGATTTERTGVEMEALTAVAVAGLTVIDMVKAVERSAVLTDVQIEAKSGGRSGTWTRP